MFGLERLSKIILVDQSPFLTLNPHWEQQELEDSGAFLTAQQVFDAVPPLGNEEAEQETRKMIDGMLTGQAKSETRDEGSITRFCLSWFYCCKSGTFGARSNAGGATLPAVVNGNSMRTRAANIATELSLHSPPCSQIISFGTRTIQQGTRALPV